MGLGFAWINPLWAPSGDGVRNPDVLAPGVSIASLRVPGSRIDTEHPNGRVDGDDRLFLGSGTSQSAAVVSGAAALLLQQRPELSPDEVKNLLTATATDTYQFDIVKGSGVVDLAAAMTSSADSPGQDWAPSTGLGSLEAARGDDHVDHRRRHPRRRADVHRRGVESGAVGQGERVGDRMVGLDVVGQHVVRLDVVGFDMVRLDVVGQHVVRLDVVGSRGPARRGRAARGPARRGRVHVVRLDVVGFNVVGQHVVMTSRGRRQTRRTRRARRTSLLARVPVRTRVMVFAAVLGALGAVLLALTPAVLTSPERSWTLPFFALVIAFGVAEGAALHVEIRKESHSLSLSAIPMMFGLLYLSPVLLLAAYVLGAVPALIWIRKSALVKAGWNACLFVAQIGVAALVVRVLLGGELPQTAIEWLVPLAAVLAAELLSLVAVPLVIMAVDAKFRPGLFAAVGQSQILAALAGAFTVTVVSASIGDPFMILFALVPVLGIGALLRSTGHLSQRFEDLQQLHSFTRVLTNERGARTLDTGLSHLVEVMRSRVAGLLTVSVDDEVASTLRLLVDDAFVDENPDAIAQSLLGTLDEGPVTYLDDSDARPEVQALLGHIGASRILAARVLGEVDRQGVLFVADRLGMRDDFNADEIRLFGSLADTLSSRLSNDHLVEELETQAQHDALTGLPNRLSFEIALTASLANPSQAGVVVMIDLDRFKEINDSLGHETGDQLLIEVARRLSTATRSTDMVARLGGDEFALLLTDRLTSDPGDMTRRIDDIHRTLTASVQISGIKFEIGASLGAAEWPTQGTDSASLLHRADTAMYQAKRNQLGVVWYTPELDADAPRRLDLYLSARSALEAEELFIHLQPKVSARDGRITGAEALVRWTHPAHGPISPAEFVPLIEHAGLIGKLTRFVLERAAQTASIFHGVGIEIPIAVNLTPRDLLDPTLPADIADILERYRLSPGALQVEITEDAMIVDFDTSVTVLTRIRELGLQVAIDDFGTGYSSLQHLHRLPVDQLKIDRSFITRLSSDESASAIVRASIGLGRDLGLRTIAEGVEDAHALSVVSQLGCEEIQGYHVSRPLPAAEFMRWVNEWDAASLHEPVVEPNPSETGTNGERVRSTLSRMAVAGR